MTSPTRQQSSRTIAVAIWTVLALSAAVLIGRRLSGAVVGPFSPGLAVLWMISSAGLAICAAWLYRRSCPLLRTTQPQWPALADGISAGLTLLAFLAVLPPWNAWALGWGSGFCLTLITARVVIYGLKPEETVTAPVVRPTGNAASLSTNTACTASPLAPPEITISNDDTVDDHSPPTQTQVRHQESHAERIEGTVKVQFLHGQREQTIHVAFCPPLGSVPDVELEDLDGQDWELKLAAAYAYGLRLIVRRPHHAPTTGEVGYVAMAETSRAAA